MIALQRNYRKVKAMEEDFELELFDEFNRLEYPPHGYSTGSGIVETKGAVIDIQNAEALFSFPRQERVAVVLDGDHVMDLSHRILSLPTKKIVQEAKELSEFRDKCCEILEYMRLPAPRTY